jgi:hypothetical protein
MDETQSLEENNEVIKEEITTDSEESEPQSDDDSEVAEQIDSQSETSSPQSDQNMQQNEPEVCFMESSFLGISS